MQDFQAKKLRKIVALIAFPAVFAVIAAFVLIYRQALWEIFSTTERIEAAVASWGWWAPAAFILAQFVQVVIFVIPGEIPQIAGGYLFGIAAGSFYSITGILLGSTCNFFLARSLGVPFVKYLFSEDRLRSFDAIMHSTRTQIAFFLLFVIPGIPKDILCYVAGLSPLRFGAFLLISTVGRLPGIVGSAAMGDAAAAKKWAFAIILAAISVVLFVAGLIFRERIHRFIERYAVRRRYSQEGETPEIEGP